MTDPQQTSGTRRARRGLIALIDRIRGRGLEVLALVAPPETEATGVLVHQARAFQELRIDHVMRPRADIVAVPQSATFAEIVERFVDVEHSRMPVYKGNLDAPLGVVHVKDVFQLLARTQRRPKPTDRILRSRHNLVRKVLYVPPSMRAAELLALMQTNHTHMALVIDEFGGTDGLVTLEDLLERLVGEIADEHDEDDDPGFAPIEADDDGWIVDGRAPLAELELAIGGGVDLAPPDLDEEIDTVAGLVMALAGRVPRRREIIDHPGGFRIEILAADPRRVKRVHVGRAPAE
jgi:CBS domain containing-hemolysin-like protein